MNKKAKAVMAALVALLGTLQLVLGDLPPDAVPTIKDWITVAAATVSAYVAVWGVPNSGFVELAKGSSSGQAVRLAETDETTEEA